MTSDKQSSVMNELQGQSRGVPLGASEAEQPEWANGLKQLYDSVVEEPLPDSFKDLLSQLDGDASQSGKN